MNESLTLAKHVAQVMHTEGVKDISEVAKYL